MMAWQGNQGSGAKPMRLALLLVGAAGLGQLAACDFQRPTSAVLGYEFDEQSCTDGIDNDQDGFVDCNDPDCVLYSPVCGERVPLVPPRKYTTLQEESTLWLCSDHVDNDVDGQFDCGDHACQGIAEACCQREFLPACLGTYAATYDCNGKSCTCMDVGCMDGIDNDKNGFTDCSDYACRKNVFVSVCVEEDDKACGDGKDNDGDGFTDCSDNDCATMGPCVETGAECGNGQDDDGDGRVDCSDQDCAGEAICKKPEDTLEACKDGIDNDGNDFVDCNDFSCSKSKDQEILDWCAQAVSTSEHSLAECSDGIDNDGNKYKDCNDWSCTKEANGASAEAVAWCTEKLENTKERCTDGVDNDANGYIDCDDFSCGEFLSESVLAACSEAKKKNFPDCVAKLEAAGCAFNGDEGTQELCWDGCDNDCDGYTDCDDYSCRESKSLATRQACQESLGATDVDAVARCKDGEDNDMDGFVDCADWDCYYNPRIQQQGTCKDAVAVCE